MDRLHFFTYFKHNFLGNYRSPVNDFYKYLVSSKNLGEGPVPYKVFQNATMVRIVGLLYSSEKGDIFKIQRSTKRNPKGESEGTVTGRPS